MWENTDQKNSEYKHFFTQSIPCFHSQYILLEVCEQQSITTLLFLKKYTDKKLVTFHSSGKSQLCKLFAKTIWYAHTLIGFAWKTIIETSMNETGDVASYTFLVYYDKCFLFTFS